MSKTIIVDGNAIGYAAHYATKLTSGKLETQAIFGFVKTMRELRSTYRDHKMIILWDGKAKWRYDLNPNYKGNREDDPKKVAIREAYAEQRPYIQRAMKHLGVRQMTVMTHEADDMAGLLVNQLIKQDGDEIVLITGDQDWIQLVRPGVTWRDIRDDSKVINMGNLMDKTGYATPYGFLEGKCLQGDTSDCIPGVGGIGEKGAPEFIAEFGSVRAFWAACDEREFIPTKKHHMNLWKGASEFTKEQWVAKYEGDPEDEKALKAYVSAWPGQGRIIFGRNLRMMQLLKVKKPDAADVRIENGKFDKDEFSKLCEELNFASILKSLDNFTNAFKG